MLQSANHAESKIIANGINISKTYNSVFNLSFTIFMTRTIHKNENSLFSLGFFFIDTNCCTNFTNGNFFLAIPSNGECERTFILLKPDTVQRGLIGKIIERFEAKGFKLVAIKFVWVIINSWFLGWFYISESFIFLAI